MARIKAIMAPASRSLLPLVAEGSDEVQVEEAQRALVLLVALMASLALLMAWW